MNSRISFRTESFSSVNSSRNVAAEKGGAIYVSDDRCESVYYVTDACSIASLDLRARRVFFYNNTAMSGPVLYGGLLDRCFREMYTKISGIDLFKNSSVYEEEPLAITSDPVKVCFCISDFQLNCTRRNVMHKAMRGGTVEAIVISVDQDENPVPSVIRTGYENTTASLGEGEGRIDLTTLALLYDSISMSWWHCIHDSVFGPKYPIVEQFQRKLKIKITS